MMSSSKAFLASLIVILACIEFSNGVILTTSCRINPTVFGPNATSCADTRDSAECKAIFPGGVSPTTRPPQCEKPELEEIALDCANTCFACCESAAYTCGDDALSPINCTANIRYCKDPSWNTVMSQYCTGTCGLCVTGTGCRDINTGCKDMRSLCNDITFNTYMRTNCQKTCNFCPLSGVSTTAFPGSGSCIDTATNCATNAALCNNPSYSTLMTQKCPRTCNRCTGSGTGNCADTNPNCASWVRNGFCTSTFYTTAQRQQYCGKSCNLC
uniref:ShKT domain-containing protein n=1 Tax=Panagrolaimus superbus TaxID=310955 RepID=A0A914YTV2_9BILA